VVEHVAFAAAAEQRSHGVLRDVVPGQATDQRSATAPARPGFLAGATALGGPQGEKMTTSAPSLHELEVIQILGETLAGRTYCDRCGMALGRGLALMPSVLPPAAAESWRLLIVTRCRGWRRHAYMAEVVDQANDLRIGQFGRL
jgi:hypothetical protein